MVMGFYSEEKKEIPEVCLNFNQGGAAECCSHEAAGWQLVLFSHWKFTEESLAIPMKNSSMLINLHCSSPKSSDFRL